MYPPCKDCGDTRAEHLNQKGNPGKCRHGECTCMKYIPDPNWQEKVDAPSSTFDECEGRFPDESSLDSVCLDCYKLLRNHQWYKLDRIDDHRINQAKRRLQQRLGRIPTGSEMFIFVMADSPVKDALWLSTAKEN